MIVGVRADLAKLRIVKRWERSPEQEKVTRENS